MSMGRYVCAMPFLFFFLSPYFRIAFASTLLFLLFYGSKCMPLRQLSAHFIHQLFVAATSTDVCVYVVECEKCPTTECKLWIFDGVARFFGHKLRAKFVTVVLTRAKCWNADAMFALLLPSLLLRCLALPATQRNHSLLAVPLLCTTSKNSGSKAANISLDNLFRRSLFSL